MTDAQHVPGIGDVTVSDRGFKHYMPIKGSVINALTDEVVEDGSLVRVYESSAAFEPYVWLAVGGREGESPAHAHLSMSAITVLIKQLQHVQANHYQGRVEIQPEWLDLCGACHGSGIFTDGAGELQTCTACSGEPRGPRRFDVGSDQPDDVVIMADHTAEGMVRDDHDSWTWGRVSAPDRSGGGSVWKGYKNGGKVYLDWLELLRRWGPLAEVHR